MTYTLDDLLARSPSVKLSYTGLTLPPPSVPDEEWFRLVFTHGHTRWCRLRPATLAEVNQLPYPDPARLDHDPDIPRVVAVAVQVSGEKVLVLVQVCDWDDVVESEADCQRLYAEAIYDLEQAGLPLPRRPKTRCELKLGEEEARFWEAERAALEKSKPPQRRRRA